MKNAELPFIRDMFDAIAPAYDLLNRLLSLRQDVWWRRAMVSAMDIRSDAVVLDVACGTGDVAFEILRQKGPEVTVFCVDFSPAMLALAREKVSAFTLPKPSSIHLLAGNAFHLPFREDTFDAITIAFGIRNIQDKLSVLNIFQNCLKPGGMLLVLELAVPPKGSFLSSLYHLYFKHALPLIGWLFSKNLDAYQYLPASVANFPKAEVFSGIMRSAGFSDIRWRNLTMGVANLYVGFKSEIRKSNDDET